MQQLPALWMVYQVARVQVVVNEVAGTQVVDQVARVQVVLDQATGAQVLYQVPELRCWIK